MLQNIKNYINKKFSDLRYRLAQRAAVRAFFNDISDKTLPSLTPEEKDLIREKWSRIIPNPSIGYHAFRVFKKIDRFKSDYVPEPYFYPYIIRILNPIADYVSLPNKGLMDSLFAGITRPDTILKRTGSNYLKGGDLVNLISKDEIVPYILGQQSDLIIKPSKDTNSGRGVNLIRSGIDRNELELILSSYSSDFIIQKKIEQSAFTAQFNPTSVNTFRIVTLFINNKISLCYGVLKLGSPGRIVDNGANGGLWVGINQDGILNDWGSNFKLQIFQEHNGILLKDRAIPNYKAIIDLAFKAHMQIPVCGLVAWDVALDINTNPLLVEANLWWPATSYGEVCNGPMFGERTEEVIEYVHSRALEIEGITRKV